MFLGINLKFANQIGDIYWRDKARSTGSASGKRERVTINWGRGESLQKITLHCGFADGNDRSPFLRKGKADLNIIHSFNLAKRNI